MIKLDQAMRKAYGAQFDTLAVALDLIRDVRARVQGESYESLHDVVVLEHDADAFDRLGDDFSRARGRDGRFEERTGIVSSFALQGEVAWLSGRRNVPAPEYVMHLYSYLFDHGIEAQEHLRFLLESA